MGQTWIASPLHMGGVEQRDVGVMCPAFIDGNVIFRRARKARIMYLKSTFVFDLLASMPVSLVPVLVSRNMRAVRRGPTHLQVHRQPGLLTSMT